MPKVLLVHGAWQSTDCWSDVLSTLADPGMQCEAITLTGLGHDTGHLNRQVGLSTHVEDVVRSIDLAGAPCVLVGHSYAGMVITGTCEKRHGHVLGLIYADNRNPVLLTAIGKHPAQSQAVRRDAESDATPAVPGG